VGSKRRTEIKNDEGRKSRGIGKMGNDEAKVRAGREELRFDWIGLIWSGLDCIVCIVLYCIVLVDSCYVLVLVH